MIVSNKLKSAETSKKFLVHKQYLNQMNRPQNIIRCYLNKLKVGRGSSTKELEMINKKTIKSRLNPHQR